MANSPESLTGPTCECCGVHLEPKARRMELALPDAVLDRPASERATLDRVGMTLHAAGVGDFVELLIPLELTDGFEMTYRAWLQIAPSDVARVRAASVGTKLEGKLASQFPPWTNEILGLPARAQMGEDGAFVLVGSSDPRIAKLVENEWPHALILGSLPEALR